MTFVLVHGAADQAASWDDVAAALRGRGHDVVAVDLPCEDDSAGLEQYTDTVVEAIGPGRDDVVVVGHSLGGYTATLVADRVAAEMLVLVSAMVPRPGETPMEFWAETGHTSGPTTRSKPIWPTPRPSRPSALWRWAATSRVRR